MKLSNADPYAISVRSKYVVELTSIVNIISKPPPSILYYSTSSCIRLWVVFRILLKPPYVGCTSNNHLAPMVLIGERSHEMKWNIPKHKFHVVACLNRRISNEFPIFHLNFIYLTLAHPQCANQLDSRSPRCWERTRDARFVLRDKNFTSWAASAGGIPMDFQFFTSIASI